MKKEDQTKETGYENYCYVKTSRDRPKSAPYPRLKISKKTSTCQFTVLKKRKTKKWTEWRAEGTLRREKQIFEVSQCRKTERGDPSGFLNTQSVAKHQKIERGKIFIFGKKPHNAKTS